MKMFWPGRKPAPRKPESIESISVEQMRDAALAWQASDRRGNQSTFDRIHDLIDEIERLRRATGEMDGGWRKFTTEDMRHFPLADGTDVEVQYHDPDYGDRGQVVMRVGSPQWKSHSRANTIVRWRPAPKQEALFEGTA
jgi:hypothetical protein